MVSAQENAELYPFAGSLLAAKVSMVPDKQGANYFVRFIVQNFGYRNISIKNTRPARYWFYERNALQITDYGYNTRLRDTHLLLLRR